MPKMDGRAGWSRRDTDTSSMHLISYICNIYCTRKQSVSLLQKEEGSNEEAYASLPG